jgi:hypothetical protein
MTTLVIVLLRLKAEGCGASQRLTDDRMLRAHGSMMRMGMVAWHGCCG